MLAKTQRALGVCCGAALGESSRKYPEKMSRKRTSGPRKSRLRDLNLFGGKMTVFSRAFVRKRVISLATTASVAATSLALAHGPTPHHVRGTMPVQYVADRSDFSGQPSFQ